MPKPNYYYVGDCGSNYFTECIIAYWIWRIMPFILLFIGTCGNILNIIILSGKQLRKYSTTVFILILAITELIVLWTSLVPDTVLSITGRRLEDNVPVVCWLRYWLSLTAGSFSTWLLVLLTIERVLLTKAPLFSRKKITPRNSLISSLIVLSVIDVMNCHIFFGNRFHEESGASTSNTTQNATGQNLPFRCYFTSSAYEAFYTRYWNMVVLILYNLVPACIIIAGNIIIASAILFRGNRVHPLQNPAESVRRKSSAKLLCILSIFYVVTTTPWCIYLVVRKRQTELSEESFARWQLATAIVNILLWCNFSFNFFFYFMSGTLFKREWNRLVDSIQSSFHRQR